MMMVIVHKIRLIVLAQEQRNKKAGPNGFSFFIVATQAELNTYMK